MPAYVIAMVQVTDPTTYEAYKTAAHAAIIAAGGRYLVRGGKSEVLEGAFPGDRVVVFEFADMAAAKAFMNSPEYAAAKAHRDGAAKMNLMIVEGLNP